MADPALRPLTLPSLSSDLVNLQQLRVQLQHAHERIQSYRQLDRKLATFTDEPTWNAYIPVGPLAYFPGQLIHTNDITRVDDPPQGDAAQQDAPPRRVLRSAKQARDDAAQAVKDLEAQVVTLTKDIEAAEADLRRKRDDERKLGNGASRAGMADMGDEDWTINAQGEVINEEGLPMFDIREDLPLEPAPVASTSKAAQAAPSNSSARARGYLIKKGGKQIVRPLPPPIPAPSSAPTSSPAPTQPSSTAPPPPPAPAPASETDPNPFPARPPLDIKAILDELEAEEAAAAAAAAAAAPPAPEGEADERAAFAESKIVELPDSPPPAAPAPAAAPASSAPKPAAPPTASAGGFAGFSAGFLAKSKQKRPSNSLASGGAAAPARSTPSSSSSTGAAAATSSSSSPSSSTPAPPASSTAAAAPAPSVPALKPALSRPVSPSARSRAATPAGDKKRVAFDLPPPTAAEEQPQGKKAPILLGPPPSSSAPAPDQPQPQAERPRVEAPAQRPIRDVVVERPLRKAVPPGATGASAGGLPVREKRLSRFKREAFGGPAAAGEHVVEGKGKGRADEHEVGPSAAPVPPPVAPTARPAEPSSAASPPPSTPSELMPAPVHTISLSARPSSSAERAPGTVSFGDIPFGSDDEDEGAPHVVGNVDGEEGGEEDDDDWDYSDDDDEDDFDDEELDVDLALHQREVALAYHRQRLMLGAGRGTGPLGGWHAEGENPFGAAADEEADQALVPADATLQSLDPSLAASTFGTYPSAGSAQEGRPSRFRQSNRNLESAQLIIPSLLAADPSLAMSHTPLGPPLEHDGEPAAAAAGDEDERLRRTLEALAEGRPLPEDEQAAERAREVALREELARDKASARRDHTAGKRPPEVVQTVVSERKAPIGVEVRQRAASQEGGVEAQPVGEQEHEEKPKKLSRFRQKQLGLIE